MCEETAEAIIEWLEGDDPYHRAKTEFELPGRYKAAYAANRELKWSEPFSHQEIANAIRSKFQSN